MVNSEGRGKLGQLVCSCLSFSMICQWSHTNLGTFLPSDGYGVATGRTVLGLDVFEVMWRKVSQKRRETLEML